MTFLNFFFHNKIINFARFWASDWLPIKQVNYYEICYYTSNVCVVV